MPYGIQSLSDSYHGPYYWGNGCAFLSCDMEPLVQSRDLKSEPWQFAVSDPVCTCSKHPQQLYNLVFLTVVSP